MEATLKKQLKHIAYHLEKHSDENLSEIMVNPDGSIWVEVQGEIYKSPFVYSAEERDSIIRLLAGYHKLICNSESPTLSVKLPIFNGGRFQGVIPPVTAAAAFSIRFPPKKMFSLEELVTYKTLTASQANDLENAVNQHKNILIVGGTGTGKTTIANALLNIIKNERLIVIEDNPELKIDTENIFHMLTTVDFDLRKAVEVSMRLRPDRIIVGEIRDGGTAVDLSKAWLSGHPGGIGTLHANNSKDAIRRLYSLMQEVVVTPSMDLIKSAIDLIVVVKKVRLSETKIVRKVVDIEAVSL